jgi:hypothetical protein
MEGRTQDRLQDLTVQVESLFESLNVISMRMETAERHHVSLWEMRRLDADAAEAAARKEKAAARGGWFSSPGR